MPRREREAYPLQARQLEAMGYDTLPAPKPIADSYIPLEECTAFALKMDPCVPAMLCGSLDSESR